MPDEEPKFQVTVEDCQRWEKKLQAMGNALRKKNPEEHEDIVRMLFTASVLVQRLAMEIEEDMMFSSISNPFGKTEVGDA